MKVYIETYGCTFNQGDSQIMAGLLQDNRAKIVFAPDDADVLIINTCYVKYPTENKVINRIHQIQKQFPQKKLIIAGCMVEIDPDRLKRVAPKAGWIGPHRIRSIFDVVQLTMNGEIVRETGFRKDFKVNLPKMRFNPFINIIQICEGCIGECSYCCTRFARGKLQSYPANIIKREAKDAIADGCVELQLTAQDTAAYGRDTGETLSDLIKQIANLEGDFRARIGMMHPQNMIDELENIINAFTNTKIYKFLHIPLQSGNDGVLNDMKRGHNVEEFKDMIKRFRKKIPEISIATDIIVGYPTEDDDAFKDTLKVIKEIRPDFIHISKYRHRPHTEASVLDEIEYETVKKRSKQLTDLKSQISYENNKKLVGTIQTILITEKGIKGGYVGRTNSYKSVVVKDGSHGNFYDVIISHAKSTYLKGNIL